MNINIAYEVTDEKISEIKKHLESEELYNPNWNGAEFQIVRDDFTCIPDDDSAQAVILIGQIFKIIDGHYDGE